MIIKNGVCTTYFDVTSILVSIYNELQVKTDFKKQAQKIAMEDIQKILKVEHKVIIDQLKIKF